MAEQGKLSEFERDLTELWTNFRVEPKYVQMELRLLRKLAAERDDAQEYLLAFLEQTKDVSDDAIAVLTPGKVTLLTNERGELLAFQ